MNFLKKLIKRLASEVFKPVPEGLLYILLQAIAREISGECPWDTGDSCYKNMTEFWYVKCRNKQCKFYRHPIGLIAYTSRSDKSSLIDNQFDYSSFRFRTRSDWIPVGTLGVEILFDFGKEFEIAGYGAYGYGMLWYGYLESTGSDVDVVIGDKWYIECNASDGSIRGPFPDVANKGRYGIVAARGRYKGSHDTQYTIEIIDFWGWIQNFENAMLQISLLTAESEWVDVWGEYFGLQRLWLGDYFESDSAFKARIMKEITRAKGTKPVLLDEAIRFFNSQDVEIVEYCQVNGWDGLNEGYNENGNIDLERKGLQAYQFYVYPPGWRPYSAKWIKKGKKLELWCNAYKSDGINFVEIRYFGWFASRWFLDGWFTGEGDYLFIEPADLDYICLISATNRGYFTGIYFLFSEVSSEGQYVWEYSTSGGWKSLTDMQDGTNGLTQTGYVSWKIPKDWQPITIAEVGATPRYWIRIRVTDQPSSIPKVIFMQVNRALTGSYVGSMLTYDPEDRDYNTCYVYRLSSFSRPVWESGLQEILDKLKTAGTVVLINPRFLIEE